MSIIATQQWNTQHRDCRTCLRCGESGKWEHEQRVRHPDGHTVMVRGCEHCFDRGGDVNHGLPLCVLGSCDYAHTIDESCEAAKARIEGAPVLPPAPAAEATCPRCGKSGGLYRSTTVHGGVHGCSLCFAADSAGQLRALCVSCEIVHTIDERCWEARKRTEVNRAAPASCFDPAMPDTDHTVQVILPRAVDSPALCPACGAPSTSERDGLPVCGNPSCRGFGWAHRHIAPVKRMVSFFTLRDGSRAAEARIANGAGEVLPASRIARIPCYRPGPSVRIEPEDWP